MQKANPDQYLATSEVLYSQQAVSDAVSCIAEQLNKDYPNKQPIVLCVMGGAVVFTGLLLPKLTFSLTFDYVHATRYKGDIVCDNLNWIVKPKENIKGRYVLILDDILDEGITLRAIADECLQLGAKEIKVAVLVNKDLNKSKSISSDYTGVTVPNRYVFGCGMDVYGWWRNLPAIYALKNN